MSDKSHASVEASAHADVRAALAATKHSGNISQQAHLLNLNPPQLQATQHGLGPLLVLAGAGSGKTRVLTRRIVHLVTHYKIPVESILAVTFTNKAAGEMKHRLVDLLGESAKRLWVSTFHSASLRILRYHAEKLGYKREFGIYDDQDQKILVRGIMKDLGLSDKQFKPVQFLSAIDRAKNARLTPELFAQQAKSHEAQIQAEVYTQYQQALMECNAMDFGDLLLNALRLFDLAPNVLAAYQQQLAFLLVDEFQDTNMVQYEFVKRLAAPQNNIFVVGDDDQSIYAFRGATVRNILDFEKDYPASKVVKLEQNYRSTEAILEASHAVICKNPDRKDKKLWTEQSTGSLVQLHAASTEGEEADFIAERILEYKAAGRRLQEIALFYRINAQTRALEEALLHAGIPYRIFGGLKFYDRKEVKDILAYLHVVANYQDNQSLLRSINTPPRGIGAKTVQDLTKYAKNRSISLYEALEEAAQNSSRLQVFWDIIQAAKEALDTKGLGAAVQEIVHRSGYITWLEASSDLQSQSRIENIRELEGLAMENGHDSKTGREDLQAFLDRTSLASALDSEEEEEQDFVSLMTLHLAKGLEYPLVFLTGGEEGLLPHQRSINDPHQVCEERRLCYVGMTRAMEVLHITRARRRNLYASGDSFGMSGVFREASRFLFDVPQEYLEDKQGDFFDQYMNEYEDVFADAFDQDPVAVDDSPVASFIQKAAEKQRFQEPKKKSSLAHSHKGPIGVVSADELVTSDIPEYMQLPRAEATDLEVGTPVVHPTFGQGRVVELEGKPTGSPRRFRVIVDFDAYAEPKKLIFAFAKLALSEQ